jgi:hypothetical protein
MKKNITEKILDNLFIFIITLLIGMMWISYIFSSIIKIYESINPTDKIESCELVWLNDTELTWVRKWTKEECQLSNPLEIIWWIILFGIVILLFCGFIIMVVILTITSIIARIWKKFLERDLSKLDTDEIHHMSIKDLLALMQRIYRHSKMLYFGNKLWNIHVDRNFRKQAKKLYTNNSQKIITILYDAKARLNSEIESIQSKLESAKWELSKIKWEEALMWAKLQQQARLDKQIEQFEELQRVLVKV